MKKHSSPVWQAVGVITMMTVFAASNALARERVVTVELGDQVHQGESVLPLKKLIKDAFPNIRLGQATLEKVVLVAKSANGNGKAQLITNGIRTPAKDVDGYQGQFQEEAPWTFDRTMLEAKELRSSFQTGAWQVALKGRIKVKKLIAVLSFDDGGFEVVKSMRLPIAPGFHTRTFAVDLRQVGSLAVQAGALTRIQSVDIVYGNGRKASLAELTGALGANSFKVSDLGSENGRRIVTIKITAKTVGINATNLDILMEEAH